MSLHTCLKALAVANNEWKQAVCALVKEKAELPDSTIKRALGCSDHGLLLQVLSRHRDNWIKGFEDDRTKGADKGNEKMGNDVGGCNTARNGGVPTRG